MAEDNYVESLLEAPYSKAESDDARAPSGEADDPRKENGKHKSSRRSRSRGRDEKSSRREESKPRDKKDRSRSRERRDRSKERRDRDKDKEKRRSRDRGDHKRSRDREYRDSDREKDRDRERRRSRDKDVRRRSKSKDKRRRRSPSPRPFRRGRTPPNGIRNYSPPEDLSPEERDARTVFCMQLSQRIRARDLEEFFSSVGKVRDVRLITCNKTKRFKGIAYIEFKDPESVPLALGLSGQKLLGIPISVQHTQAEKNRMANSIPTPPPKNPVGPMRLYVGSLHFNITEDMLRGIFEPFGKIDNIQLIMDADSGRSKGYGFITFNNADDAKKALEQLNGFELAGRPMKVGNVTERLDVGTSQTSLDTDDTDRNGIDLGATGRLQLMFKLAEGAGLAVPRAAADALMASLPQPTPAPQIQQETPPIATQCFMLSNMFDPATETNLNWDQDIRDDVIEECNIHGGVWHIYVDVASPTGNVYVKCPSIATAVLAVNSLHGRWFAGRVITAAYVPLIHYHQLFPDSMAVTQLIGTTRKA